MTFGRVVLLLDAVVIALVAVGGIMIGLMGGAGVDGFMVAVAGLVVLSGLCFACFAVLAAERKPWAVNGGVFLAMVVAGLSVAGAASGESWMLIGVVTGLLNGVAVVTFLTGNGPPPRSGPGVAARSISARRARQAGLTPPNGASARQE